MTPPVARVGVSASSAHNAGTCDARCSTAAWISTRAFTGTARFPRSGMARTASDARLTVSAVA
eukprot:8191873-Alexandrium_andersonii.AAC.1